MATQKQKEKALERAAKAQTRFWDALHALEQALGFDVDAAELGELSAYTVDDLEGGQDCSGGCGRPVNECASHAGADYCADVDDYLKYGKPKTWEAFEKKHFPGEAAG